MLGDPHGAQAVKYNDSDWEIVHLPDAVRLEPENASGGRNYQGVVWYRKRFSLPPSLKGKRLLLYFEAVMGKSEVWINGRRVFTRRGGYLPLPADITEEVYFGGRQNVVAVRADNGDDPGYPPGKPQGHLDFTYLGGMYRDVFLVATDPVYITDPIEANETAGGGIFFRCAGLEGNRAHLALQTNVHNRGESAAFCSLELRLMDAKGKTVFLTHSEEEAIRARTGTYFQEEFWLKDAKLWHPDHPYLYTLEVKALVSGRVADNFRTKIGIRTVEFRGEKGFFINGRYLKLRGANRHQDFAYVGNALPNSGQYRDAVKLREAGMNCIRAAHYPMDPAFMDACDEVGLLVIVPTPGWQFFNPDQGFLIQVYRDIRDMVRRDRNRACVFLWEPILNETHYPEDFARKVHHIVHEEYPYPGCYTAADFHLHGGHFDVTYGGKATDGHPVFQREIGDCVEDWESQNAVNRVDRAAGETAQLAQANYQAGIIEHIHANKPVAGACLWAGIDHQRGYHVDPFRGGILDCFRLPKYSFYLFKSQQDSKVKLPGVDTGPMIFIANEFAPQSPADVTVFTNCEKVRLTVLGKKAGELRAAKGKMPYPPLVFKRAFNWLAWQQAKEYDTSKVGIVIAEGLIGGKVAARHVRYLAGAKAELKLELDAMENALTADGADFVPVYAQVVDKSGNRVSQARDLVYFDVKGEGQIIGDAAIDANPFRTQFGTAVAFVRSTLKPGRITVRAFSPGLKPAEISVASRKPELPTILGIGAMERKTGRGKTAAGMLMASSPGRETDKRVNQLEAELTRLRQQLFAIQQSSRRR